MATNIWGEEVLDSKNTDDKNSVLYRGDLLSKSEVLKNDNSIALNPKTEKLLTQPEIESFRQLLIPQSGNPYAHLKKILEKLSGVEFPELPTDTRLTADWYRMYYCWFFETIEDFSNAQWSGNSKTTFFDSSAYCYDIANSVSFNDTKNDACIKRKFFRIPDSKRSNPFTGTFEFVGNDSGRKDYYSWVEWFIGSYSATIYWSKGTNGQYEINALISNTSSWYSGTRLPKSWQDKIKKEFGFDIRNLVDSAPRGETIKRKLPKIVIETLEWMGVVIPSFGGNWSQEFKVKTVW